MNEPLTIMNIRVMELEDALGRILDPKAYKEIKGTRKKGMTDTRAQYVRQRCVEVFGPAGYGWYLDTEQLVSEHNPEAPGGNVWTSTLTARFYYRYKVGDELFWSEPVTGTGGVSMDRKDFAERGAVTNALGDALKFLGFQAGLWFDKFNHNNASAKYKLQQDLIAKWQEAGKHVPGEPIKVE